MSPKSVSAAKIALHWSSIKFSGAFQRHDMGNVLGKSMPVLRRKLAQLGGRVDMITDHPHLTMQSTNRGMYLGEFIHALKMLETGISSPEERAMAGIIKHINDPDYESSWRKIVAKAERARKTSAKDIVHAFFFSVDQDPSTRAVNTVRIRYSQLRNAHDRVVIKKMKGFSWEIGNKGIVPSFVQPLWNER